MWFPAQVLVSSLFFTHQPPSTETAVGIDQSSGRQQAHPIFWLAEGKTPVHEVPGAGNGETGFQTGVSDCL